MLIGHIIMSALTKCVHYM